MTLLEDAGSNLRIDLVHLEPRESDVPPPGQRGLSILAVASGLVQVTVGDHAPTVRSGEVLVAAGERIDAWRNLGQAAAVAFCIATTEARRSR